MPDPTVPPLISFRLPFIQTHPPPPSPPLILGLSGIQGIGKSSLAFSLSAFFGTQNLPTLSLSLDNFYHPHATQALLFSSTYHENPLLQRRGLPGTHDLLLLSSALDALRERRGVRVPVYDKSAFGGEGDRLPEEQWQVVSEEQARSVRVVLLEGWCVGYRALAEEDLQGRWLAAQEGPPGSELAAQEWADVQMINTLLQDYEAAVSARLDAFVLLDCERLEWAYGWREEQEQRLREKSSGGGGKGMTEAQVVEFVRGYFPAYELYVEPLRRGRVVQREGANVRIVLDRERKVLSHSLV